jgi:8-hydroxy-5-deazaflavin:NADPH oxidoreductase
VIPHSFRLAVLGAGHVGPVIARLAVRAGYPVAIATSGDPDDLALIAELLIPGAGPRWSADAVGNADVVVLAIPLHRFADLSPALLAGKIVVDAMNYWPASDGVAGEEPAAVDVIAGFVGRLGYDPVRLDSLRTGRVLQPGGPVFGVTLTRPEFEQAIREEARSLTP